MNIRVITWAFPYADSAPHRQRDGARTLRELEGLFEERSRADMVARVLPQLSETDERVVRVPEWLARLEEIPTHGGHAVLHVDEMCEDGKCIHVSAVRAADGTRSVDQPGLPVAGEGRLIDVDVWLPKTMLRLYEWRQGRPDVECWNCGDVIVGADRRIIGEREFPHPDDPGTSVTEQLCDDCAAALVPVENVEACAACGEQVPTSVMREVGNADGARCQCLCSECADEAVDDRSAEQTLTT